MEITLQYSKYLLKSLKMRKCKSHSEYWSPTRNTILDQPFTPTRVRSQGETQRWQVDGSTIPPPLSYQSPIGTMEVHNASVLNEQRSEVRCDTINVNYSYNCKETLKHCQILPPQG